MLRGIQSVSPKARLHTYTYQFVSECLLNQPQCVKLSVQCVRLFHNTPKGDRREVVPMGGFARKMKVLTFPLRAAVLRPNFSGRNVARRFRV